MSYPWWEWLLMAVWVLVGGLVLLHVCGRKT